MAQANAAASEDPLWPLKRAAEYLSISPRTLQAAASARLIGFVRASKRRIAFRLSELNRYADARTQRAE